MLLTIHPRKLNRYISHFGVYIYFYNHIQTANNKTIVDNMRKLAHEYKKLNVFEISWKDQIIFRPYTCKNIVNNVFLYSNGILKERKENPNDKDVQSLFNNAIYYYNMNIEIKMKNIGIRSKYYDLRDKNSQDQQEEVKAFLYYIEEKRRSFKYKIINTKKVIKYNQANVKREKKLDLLNLNNNDMSQNILLSEFNNTCKSFEPWYYDVKMTNLPIEITPSEQIKNEIHIDSCKINENDIILFKSDTRSCDVKSSIKHKSDKEPNKKYNLQIQQNKLCHNIKDKSKVMNICFKNKLRRYDMLKLLKMVNSNKNNVDIIDDFNSFVQSKEYQPKQKCIFKNEDITHLKDHNYYEKY